MADLSSILEAHRADLERAVRLEEVEAADDPEEAPYRSQYEARELFSALLDALPEQKADGATLAVRAALAARIGANLCDTNERPEGEARLLHALALCREGIEQQEANGASDAPFLGSLVHALNTLGRLFSDRADNDQALLWLREAERQFKRYSAAADADGDGGRPPPVSFRALLRLDAEPPDSAEERRRFETVHTSTLYYLAQVHCKLPNHAALAARYCGATLARQMAAGEYDPLDWALNAGALSQFFLTKGRFEMARYCLASAEAMFAEQVTPPAPSTAERVGPTGGENERAVPSGEENERLAPTGEEAEERVAPALPPENVRMAPTGEEEERVAPVGQENERTAPAGEENNESVAAPAPEESEKVAQARADLHRCWAKYGLSLLDPTSTPAEERKEEEEEAEREAAADLDTAAALRFSRLTGIGEHEAEVACQRPEDMETARPIFLFVQRHLAEAKRFYVFEEHCSDHVAVVQDHSNAFRLLADYYEPEVERQCRMHKRRVDMLRELVDQLNPQHYLMIVRQMLFECGEILQAMVNAKTSALSMDMPRKEMAHAVKKINALAHEGIAFYERFLGLFARPDGSMPEQFPAEETRPALLAHFHIGHLHSKLLGGDKGARIRNIEASVRSYSAVVDYCDQWPAARVCVREELPLCEEMVQLLPGKIRKIALDS